MKIAGFWYSGQSSSRQRAELHVSGKRYVLILQESSESDGPEKNHGLLSDLSVSDRVGNIPRKLYWPDGAMLESRDNHLIDQALSSAKHPQANRQIFHRLENSGRFALFSLVLALLLAGAFFKWGVPLAAKHAAMRMPLSFSETISKGTFETLEKYVLKPSELSEQRQAEIQARFIRLVASVASNTGSGEAANGTAESATGDIEAINFRLYFRALNGIPNALALPGGQIIVTDSLAELVENLEELDSILLHEIGHVVRRHGLQAVIQGTALSTIAALVIGDVSGSAELIAGLPVFLMQSSYSRKSESEADEFAFAHMVQQDIDPAVFASIIQKLSGIETKEGALNEKAVEDEKSLSEYLSSHPDSRARALKALEYSQQHFAR